MRVSTELKTLHFDNFFKRNCAHSLLIQVHAKINMKYVNQMSYVLHLQIHNTKNTFRLCLLLLLELLQANNATFVTFTRHKAGKITFKFVNVRKFSSFDLCFRNRTYSVRKDLKRYSRNLA